MSRKKTPRIDPAEQPLPPGGADSHAHLDGPEFDGDREEVLTRAAACGVSHIGNVFLSLSAYQQRRGLFSGWPGVFFLLGTHPTECGEADQATVDAMGRAFAADPRLRAVGEIGLDYHWAPEKREAQLAAFGRQLDMARSLARPVVIHCREAEDDCLTLLEARGFAGYPLLWHCFGGSWALARRILENGWHISVPGPLTYPANSALREAVARIPGERLLLETDSPYLSPVPWRGTRDEPAYTIFTAREAARVRGEAEAELWRACGDNTRRFFGLES